MIMAWRSLSLLAALLPRMALAHREDAAAGLGWHDWSLEPWSLALLLLFGAWYGLGLSALWRASGAGAGVQRAQAACWWSGWMLLALALLSPLDVLGGELFWMHMVQHEIIMILAAPLMILGRPLPVLLWGMPRAWRRKAAQLGHAKVWLACWQGISSPLTAWFLHAAAIWLWHLPSLFQAALENQAVHTLQHLSFFLSALLFWWSVLRHSASRAQLLPGLVSVFTTAVHTSALGALLTFAGHSLYPVYATTAARWGLSALEDQQLGGLVMWVPGGLAYLVAAMLLMLRLFEGQRTA